MMKICLVRERFERLLISIISYAPLHENNQVYDTHSKCIYKCHE